MSKKNKLSKLSLDEVSLCREGMNPESDVLLFKMKRTGSDPAVDNNGNTLSKEIEMDKKELEALQKSLKETTILASLNDAQKTVLFKMSAEDQAKVYAEADVAKRAELLKEKPVPVVDTETLVINGETFKKADVGVAAFAILKATNAQTQALMATIEKQGEALEVVTLSKEAETRWPSTPGSTEEKAKLLKAARCLPKASQDVMLSALDSAERAHKENARVLGYDPNVNKGEGEEAELPNGEPDVAVMLDRLADKRAGEKKISKAAAMVEIMTEEPALYAAYDRQNTPRMSKDVH